MNPREAVSADIDCAVGFLAHSPPPHPPQDDFKSMKDLVQGLHLDPQGKVEMIDRLRRSSRLGETSNQAKRAR